MDRNKEQNSFSNMHGTRSRNGSSRYRKKYKRAAGTAVVFFLICVFLATYLVCEHWPAVKKEIMPVSTEGQSNAIPEETESVVILSGQQTIPLTENTEDHKAPGSVSETAGTDKREPVTETAALSLAASESETGQSLQSEKEMPG